MPTPKCALRPARAIPCVILDRSENPNYAIGRANALSACASAECAGPCDL